MSDLISRADTLAKIKEYCIDGDSVVQKWFDIMGIEEIINTMPSVSADAVSREAIISAKFHPYPYTHITPTDVEAESYKRGWNDALDAVADNAPTAESVTHIKPNTAYCENGEWRVKTETSYLIEVVRCKDCRKKYVRQLDNKIFCQRTARAVDPDDYCSKGELKDVGY